MIRNFTTRSRGALSATAAAALALMVGSAQAADFTYAIGYAPGSGPALAAESLAKRSTEYGGPDIQVFAMSLLNIKETPPGVKDRIVDLGFNAHGLFRAEYPNANLPAEFGVRATNATPASNVLWGPAAMAGAITEYIMLHCPECSEEFAREGQVYLSGQSSASYGLHCSQDITTLEQLKGKQVRTPSGYWATWVEEMGAVSVFMSANEAFSALSQGVVDCVVFQPSDLLTTRLIDVVKSTTLGVPQGVYSAAAVASINTDAWKELSAGEREGLLKAAAYMNAEMTFLQASQTAEALEEEKARGIPVLEAAPDLKEATNAFVAGLRQSVVEEYMTQYQLQDIETKIDTIYGLIDKWVGLTENVEDTEDLYQLYLSEIVSQIDPEAYGL
jgi:hypothetical protein